MTWGKYFAKSLDCWILFTEGHRPFGRLRVRTEVNAGRSPFAEAVPAPHHAGAVVHIDIARAIGQQLVQVHTDLFLVHVEDDDLVWREDAQLDGLTKAEPVELRARTGFRRPWTRR